MERLNAEDQIMLWPDQLWPQEIGALAILDGGALSDIQWLIEGRLHLVPRFRQLLHTPRRGLGGPLWADAPHFALADHIQAIALPAPADETTLLTEVERLRAQRLDRSRPLWRMYLLTGLPGNRVGLFVKMHHAIADGIAGIATISAFLDTTPGATAGKPVPWAPQPAPGTLELFTDNLRFRIGRLGHALSALAHAATTVRRARYAWQQTRKLLATPPATTTSLNHVIGADRALTLIRGDLQQAKHIAHTHHATVNDVLLTLVAGGLRALLTGRGEPVDDLSVRIDVPVTLRPVAGRDQARSNLVGQIFVPAPLGIADPRLRLKHIAADTATLKAQPHVSAGVLLRSRFVRRAALKLLDRRPVNVTTADLIGPPMPVYLAGARLLEVFPLLPLMANVSLGVGALSYVGQFNLTVVADHDTYPDLDVFVAGVRDDLATLART